MKTILFDFDLTFSFSLYLPCWPSCLDRSALINVDSPGCGTSVVQGPSQVGRFSSWGTVVPRKVPTRFSSWGTVVPRKVPTSRHVHNSLNRVLTKEAILV